MGGEGAGWRFGGAGGCDPATGVLITWTCKRNGVKPLLDLLVFRLGIK